ncbi:hypothetical protein EWM64_g928 [Hericium alpestre]|uniref:Glucose-methanol-choline oxidoreductase C-terminal domain-containing protein n=1 Tax=Hericium alpestre TaxID=135208 RepID=A0A4Z0AAT1_9AGAM|nr:hypothetical protein EWM64_g928 [Hericium alpestre]
MSDSLHILNSQPLTAMIELLKYVTVGRGLFVVPFAPTSIFVPSRLLNKNSKIVGTPAPAITVAFCPSLFSLNPLRMLPLWSVKGIFTFLTTLLKPKSVGTMCLASADPRAWPDVQLGYLSNPEDYIPLQKCVRLALRLAEQMRAQGYPLKDLLVPETENDADMDRFIRANLRTSYHYSSTCRMAREVEGGVVDDDLRVYGVQGLRVCDTSVFPEIVATHTMAPAVVVAEKCADLIKATWR